MMSVRSSAKIFFFASVLRGPAMAGIACFPHEQTDMRPAARDTHCRFSGRVVGPINRYKIAR